MSVLVCLCSLLEGSCVVVVPSSFLSSQQQHALAEQRLTALHVHIMTIIPPPPLVTWALGNTTEWGSDQSTPQFNQLSLRERFQNLKKCSVFWRFSLGEPNSNYTTPSNSMILFILSVSKVYRI